MLSHVRVVGIGIPAAIGLLAGIIAQSYWVSSSAAFWAMVFGIDGFVFIVSIANVFQPWCAFPTKAA